MMSHRFFEIFRITFFICYYFDGETSSRVPGLLRWARRLIEFDLDMAQTLPAEEYFGRYKLQAQREAVSV